MQQFYINTSENYFDIWFHESKDNFVIHGIKFKVCKIRRNVFNILVKLIFHPLVQYSYVAEEQR